MTNLSWKKNVNFKIERGLNTEGILYRVELNSELRLQCGTSLTSLTIDIYTNCPSNSDGTFIRENFRKIAPVLEIFDQLDSYYPINCSQSGSFEFYFVDHNLPKNKLGSGYFIVDPVFISQSGKVFEADSLVVHTYLAKSLGDFNTWRDKLSVSHHSGYNMIHFTPLQHLGYSRSAYSIFDQLNVNPELKCNWSDIKNFIDFMEKEWDMRSMTDLVLNHTATNSLWIQDHPECGYNLVNSKHLRPAFFLDYILWNITLDATDRMFECDGLPKSLTSYDQLAVIRVIAWRRINEFKMEELFILNTQYWVDKFIKVAGSINTKPPPSGNQQPPQIINQSYTRFGAEIDIDQCISYFYNSSDDKKVETAAKILECHINDLNSKAKDLFYAHICAAVDNFEANCKWRFLDPSGPKNAIISKDEPLMWNYFTHPKEEKIDLHHIEKMIELADAGDEKGLNFASRLLAFNGWVINNDPLRNFAESTSNVYLRRELIVWGDSIKLRYGTKPEDCPYLWDRMQKYVELTVDNFHAVRLDNCHSTPIHVAQWLLDKARARRKNLYVVAELFTGNQYLDNMFMNKLGINSLIREGISAQDSHDLGRLIHLYGGLPVGSFFQSTDKTLLPSTAHALMYDVTHDNVSLSEKHCVFDAPASSSLICVANCAIGSNRGHDELVPHHINVVTEEREYAKWNQVGLESGIISIKSQMNKLHRRMTDEGFSEVFVDQVDSDIVAITRHNPTMRTSYLTIAHTVFNYPPLHNNKLLHRPIKIVNLSGFVTEIVLENLFQLDNKDDMDSFKKDSNYINGLSKGFRLDLKIGPLNLTDSRCFRVQELDNGCHALEFFHFPPGSVIVLKLCMPSKSVKALSDLKQLFDKMFGIAFQSQETGPVIRDLSKIKRENLDASLKKCFSELDFLDYNFVLFRCNQEDGNIYNIPGFGSAIYCGLQGIYTLLDSIGRRNDLGHPLCGNIRKGNWLLDHTITRFKMYSKSYNILAIENLANIIEKFSNLIQDLPNYLRPCYTEHFYALLIFSIKNEILFRFSTVAKSSQFRHALLMNSIIFIGDVPSCVLPPLSDSQKPLSKIGSISAGLPHFSQGIFRAWGRDTFISFRGLLLLPGRFDEARELLLRYSAILRHGLIPNLLGSWDANQNSIAPRYNCRDAVWWWLVCIKFYCSAVGDENEGKFLSSKVARLFSPSLVNSCRDLDSLSEWRRYPNNLKAVDTTLMETIMEALQAHSMGTNFTEWGYDRNLDDHMSWEGFQMSIGLCFPGAMPFGGNSFNCGTWMDKMGSSDKAGNRAKPATSRDGIPVELVGLCYAFVSWLSKLHSTGKIQESGVESSFYGGKLTWEKWSQEIEINFDKFFYVSDSSNYNVGIYKDVHGSSLGWPDFQFRPNFLITMTIAPQLFDINKAWAALQKCREKLLGNLGIKTLAQNDFQYRGFYDNANDSNDGSVAKGFNYHQGPEWLWLTGYYIRAYLIFAKRIAESQREEILEETYKHILTLFYKHKEHILLSEWISLPELTNENGIFCADSCPAQAWSAATMLEAHCDFENFRLLLP